MLEVLTVINEIAQKSLNDNYIYRGESKNFERVSSQLYRDAPTTLLHAPNMEFMEQTLLREARRYTTENDEMAILTELQHYGGSTNLIDFTTDFLIATFFACNGHPEEDGRIIFLSERSRLHVHFYRPKERIRRVIAQKSVFVRPPSGYIEDDQFEAMVIPSQLKQRILEYLRRGHGIAWDTIYNDLHGYIRQRAIHKESNLKFYEGFTSTVQGDNQAAIKAYTESIALNSQNSLTFNNRGACHFRENDYDLAKKDFDRAISINPRSPHALFNRSICFMVKERWKEATLDLLATREIGGHINEMFHSEYTSINDFEQTYSVKIPSCLVEILADSGSNQGYSPMFL